MSSAKVPLAIMAVASFLVVGSAQAGDARFVDCNENGLDDHCDIDCEYPGCGGTLRPECGWSPDCNGNWIPDGCELASFDCNDNGIPDDCDIADEFSEDTNHDGIPDECQDDVPTVSEWGLAVLALLVLTAGTLIIQRRAAASC